MRSRTDIAVTAARWVLGIAALTALLLLGLLRTQPGQDVLARAVGTLSGGTVSVQGLSGDLPGNLQADMVEISDKNGVWLRIENLSLDWDARRALSHHIAIRRVTASNVVLLRKPISETSNGTTPKIDIGELSVARIEIAKAAVGQAAILRAQGSLHYRSVHQARANLIIRRLDAEGSYRLQGKIDHDVANGTVIVAEGAEGILGALIGLPGLNPVNLAAQAGGTRAANTIVFQLSAGALRASGNGTIALAHRSAAIDFSAHAPAMKLGVDVAWQLLALQGHVRGAFDAPGVSAALRISGAEFAGFSSAKVAADVTGGNGKLHVVGEADALRVPGGHPDLFAGAPAKIDAMVDLAKAAMPIAFSISHPLLAVRGHADMEGTPRVSATVTVPSLAPFAALQNIDAGGPAQFEIAAARNGTAATLAVDGRMDVRGASTVARLLGRNATLSLRAETNGPDIVQSRLLLQGAGLRSETTGNFRNKSLNYAITLALPDLSRLVPALNGSLSLSGIANGPLDAASLHLSGKADMASRGFARQNIGIDIQSTGLTKLSAAQLRAHGSFDNAPVLVAATYNGGQGGRAELAGNWKSVHAKGDLAFSQSGALAGPVRLDIGNLGDIAFVTGGKLAGSLRALIDLKSNSGKTTAMLRADAKAVSIAGARVATAAIHGAVENPFGAPSLAVAFSAQGLQTGGVRGDAQGRIDGAASKLALALKSDLQDPSDNPIHLAANAVIDLPKGRASLQRLNATWHDQALKLRAPATVDFAHGLSVNDFSANVAGGTLDASGNVTPKLALKISARAIKASALNTFLPEVDADGTFSATAQLSGTLDAPRGTVVLQGRDLRARNYSGSAIAPANIDAHANLHGATATVTATLTAGKSAHVTLSGEAPLSAGAKANLRAQGAADLAMLNPILLTDGRQARGSATVNLHIAGTMNAPYAIGSVTIKDGDIQDFARGARVHDIDMTIEAEGARLRIIRLSARAGPGTIDGSGTIDLAAAGMPIDVTLKMKQAQPIASALMTATLSGDVKFTGKLRGTSTLSGKLSVTRGEINLPDRFPPQVAVLDVRRRGQKLPPPPPEPTTIALDLAVTSFSQIFVRGHGIDANLGGRIHLTGTTGAPFVSGGFDMERGTFSLAGQTLDFTSGKVSFDGTGVRYRLDPTLNFVAQTTSGGVTATLTVGGYASAPKIALTSTPQLPQDEILAHLLFRQGTKQLSPLQMAQIAQVIAALGGVGGGFNPLGALRKSLGLDRLSVGSTTGGAAGSQNQTTVEAGKYVARNVYVGARQNLSGGTQVQIQLDITKRLKAQATLSTMTNATATKGNAAQDNGSSVGLSYEFEY